MTDTIPTPGANDRPALFALGQVVATPGALAALEEHAIAPETLLARHLAGDWGVVAAEDAAANDAAVKLQDRLLSAYVISPGVRVWVITEHDRSSTTLLLPSEY